MKKCPTSELPSVSWAVTSEVIHTPSIANTHLAIASAQPVIANTRPVIASAQPVIANTRPVIASVAKQSSSEPCG